MSGFVGLVHLDRSPVDQLLLHRLVTFQRFRGSDAQNAWAMGCVGFGHTLLKVGPESEYEHQPLSLDGETWIVGDCRIDARTALIAELQSRGNHAIAEVSDAELVLRAYHRWGDDCVEHLLGDFAFAVWNCPRQRLFCARDQIGVKPFYYAHVGSRLIFANTLDCVRQHPAVSDALNDLAIADFLLFDAVQEPAATSFGDIRRLPPAHTLTMEGEKILTRRYWTLRVSEPPHCANGNECLDQFRELLDAAVSDRLRTSSAGVMMSGGLDSSTVAASAQKMLVPDENLQGLCAYTEVFNRLIPHEERHYAGLVAEALKIPIQFHIGDDSGFCEPVDRADPHSPEPVHSPWSDGGHSLLRKIAITHPVALTGFGGDPALSCLLSVHFVRLLKRRHFHRLIADAARYLAAEGRLSRLYIRTRWRRWFPSKKAVPQYPRWLNPDFEKRLDLRQRWQALNHPPSPENAVRPMALEAVSSPSWPALFEDYDPGVTRVPVEVRHPFFDLRLLGFLVALPALPWCSDKELLRQAARGVLPDAVRLRRKSPLVADPLIALLQRPEAQWLDSFTPCADLPQFVRPDRIPRVVGEKNAWSAWINLRPLSLNFWLRSRGSSGITT